MTEFELISQYLAPLSRDGFNDDVGVIAPKPTQIITTDTLVEGVHFLPDDPPETLGHKLVRVNVSDIWAKGGRPSEALFNLGWPKGRNPEDLEKFLGGFANALREFSINLLGGDTVSSPIIHLSLSLMGDVGTRGPVTRSKAAKDDDIWVSGVIGAGLYGLRDARASTPSEARAHYWMPNLCDAALVPAIAQYASASLDVSDGLLQDAGHIARLSGVEMVIALEDVPLYVQGSDLKQALTQLTGGDDYQILFTAPPKWRSIFQPFARRIGDVRQGHGVRLNKGNERVSIPNTQGHQHAFS